MPSPCFSRSKVKQLGIEAKSVDSQSLNQHSLHILVKGEGKKAMEGRWSGCEVLKNKKRQAAGGS